jgi:hypothetical protein
VLSLFRHRSHGETDHEGVVIDCTTGADGVELRLYNGASFPIGVVNDPFVPSVYVNDDGSFSLVHGVTPGLSTTFDSRIVRRLDFIHPGQRRVWRARVLSDVLRQYERGAVRLRVPVPDTAEVYCILGWWKVTQNGDTYDVSRVVSDEKFVWAGPLVIP